METLFKGQLTNDGTIILVPVPQPSQLELLFALFINIIWEIAKASAYVLLGVLIGVIIGG